MTGATEPRIHTEPLRELTPETSLGFSVCDFATEILGTTLMPWQRWLFIHALEIVGDFEGEWHFRFMTVVVIIARQNGKTFVGKVLAAYFLYVLGVSLILGTAQDLEQAEDTWAETVEAIQSVPELKAEIEHVWYTNGAKRLSLTGGRSYRVKASTAKAGRGKSADLVLVDELREHKDFGAWGALAHTTLAKPDSLKWCMSNAGDGGSVVLRHLRQVAHAALGDPDGICAATGSYEAVPDDEADASTTGYFEWSAEPGADPSDRSQWALANPSLGYGLLTERALADSYANDTRDVFLTECLCQWVTATADPPFPAGAWEEGTDPGSAPAADSPVAYGVDVAADRSKSSVAVAAVRPDGSWHGELVAYRSGTAWLRDWFAGRADPARPMRVGVQASGAPASAFCDILAAVDGVDVVECKGRDVCAWAGRLWDAVAACAPDAPDGHAAPLRHRPQPALDLAAQVAATRPLGDGAWAWDRHKSTEDISPLVALTMALGAAQAAPDEPVESAYETYDLMTL